MVFHFVKREDIVRDIHGLDAQLARWRGDPAFCPPTFTPVIARGELEQSGGFILCYGFFEALQEWEMP